MQSPRAEHHLAILLGILLALAVSCAGRRPAAPTPLPDGRADYRAACASCHGSAARGDGPVAASLETPPADLTLLAARHGGKFPFEAVVATIAGEDGAPTAIPAHGSRAMPVWSLRFGADAGATAVAAISARRRVEAVARHLETLQRMP